MEKVRPIYKEKHETGYKCEFGNCQSHNAVVNHKGAYFCATHAYYVMTGKFLALEMLESEKANRKKVLPYCEREEELNYSDSQINNNNQGELYELI